MYYDLDHKYSYDDFVEFFYLILCISETFSTTWWKQPNFGFEYLTFQIKDKLYMMHKKKIGFGSYVYGGLRTLRFGYLDYENAMHYYNHLFHC